MKKLVVLLTFFLFCNSLMSQERRLALVIGNGNYKSSILANPENDAKSIEIALKEIGFEVKKYENLGQKEMTKTIDEFGNRLKNYDVGLFFYAGHGVQSKGFNYLIPVDADLNSESDVEYNCVRADRVLGKMEDAKSKINLVILDACRDNPFERSWTRAARGRGLATMTAPVGSIIAFATAPESTASDGSGKNGLYTSGLLAYMNEPGITAIQMFQKVTAYVLRKSNNQQLPWLSTSLTGDFYLVPGSGKPDKTLVINNMDTEIAKNIDENSPSEKSIVVLPFKNLTGKPDQDYLVEGQHDVLITELSKISQVKALRVLSGQTASTFANTDRSIPEIAKESNVDYIIEGSVLDFGDSVTLNLRLLQAFPKEKPLWAQTYKSDMRNVIKLYNNIAGQIAQKIDLGLTPQNLVKLPSIRQINPETYKSYLRGMYNLKQGTPESIKKGFEYLNEAIRLDPADPFAYTALAHGYFETAHGTAAIDDAIDKGAAAAFQAIKLDTTMAETYATLGAAYLLSLWKVDEAEKYFRKAISLDPNLAWTHFYYAWTLYLVGRKDEALIQHELAKKYDPFDQDISAQLSFMYTLDGYYDKAIKEALNSLEILKDNSQGLWALGDVYRESGRINEAIETHKKLAEKYPEWKWVLGCTYAMTGKCDEAEKILAEMNKSEVNSWVAFGLIALNAALNKKDEAFKWLDYEPHHEWLPWVVADLPWFNNLHGDPRFDEFVKKLNLPGK
jgi:TolB-like protein/Flp pilus assembly protein TadD